MYLLNNIRFKNVVRNFLLGFLSVVVALSLVEVALRIYNPLGFRIKGDKVILPVNKNEIRPHADSVKLDRNLTIHRNSLGFRGAEPPPDFAEWLTIVTVGGSTTECRELADAKTWPQILESKLQGSFPRVWLNNAGLSGHSTFGHLILVQDYLAQLKPKVILFLVGVNDLGLEAGNNADRTIKEGFTFSSFRSLERFLGALAESSEVAAMTLNLKRYFFPKIETQIAYDEIDFHKLPVMAMSEKSSAEIKRTYRDRYLPAYKTRLEQLIAAVKRPGMVPVLVTQPALYGKGTDDVTGVDLGAIRATKTMNGRTAWEVLEMYNDVTRKTCGDQGVLVIDLAGKMPKSSRYYYDLLHYTNEGAEKVAEIVFEELGPFLASHYQDYKKTPMAVSFR